jgi:putative endopeptidase
MRMLNLAIFLFAVAFSAAAQNAPASPALPAQQPIAAESPSASNPAVAIDDRPLAALPYSPSLDLNDMDKTADPCVDFYQYSCGGWIKNNPIPADEARWDVYGKLYQDNQRFLWGILDQLSKQTAGRNAAQQKIGDYFGACMDETAVEKLGAKPLQRYLHEIDTMKSKQDLPALLARLHLITGESGLFFRFGSDQDFENSDSVITFAMAGGIGLPDRDYYTKTDEKSVELRNQYVAHVQRMFELVGDKPKIAKAEAGKVMEIETALAKSSLTQVEKRDPNKLFHKVDFKGLQEMTPTFDWAVYIKEVGLPAQNTFNVTEPAFYKEFNRQFQSLPLADIKIYLRWHVSHADAPFLSSAFVNENFNFYDKTLSGTPQLRPRWKRCTSLVDKQLGEALGQEFVVRAFSPELKQKTLLMTKQIEDAMGQDIQGLNWMSPETKQKALEKLHTIVNKIGYPERWRDYSSVEIKRDDFLGNVEHARLFESHRQLNKIGKPLDRGEWSMTPSTVDAEYSQKMNAINFPAAVLQPPLYDPKMDDAPNYGNTGATIGHELTHCFDDEGRQFDAKGNLKDWWGDKDAKAFTDRAQCIVDQYAQYTVVDNIKINSKLTEGEDIADLGGVILAWMAWKEQTKGKQLEPREGFTPEQRFFIGDAQWTCENVRPEELRLMAVTNPHSPGKYRVNGLVVNMPEFQQAFSCKTGQPMVKENRCRVW